MSKSLSIESIEALIAEEKIARAQTVLRDFYKKLAELQNEIDELKGERVSKDTKNARFELRLTEKELENLKQLAEKQGVNTSDLVRIRVPEMSISA